MTYWLSEPDDPAPSLLCNLKAPYSVHACRIFWHDDRLDYDEGAVPGPIGFLLEGQQGDEWIPLINCTDNDVEYNIDYREFLPVVCHAVRLTITKKPERIHPGIIDFTVFGLYAGPMNR